MINQNIVFLTNTVALKGDTAVSLEVDYSITAREAADIQRDLDEVLKYVRLAVKARPGSEYREALEERVWQCWQHLYRWGSPTIEV